MKITAVTAQVRTPDRVNISIDGVYRCSLTINQLVESGLRVGDEVDADQIAQLVEESEFGKVYQRALEYSFVRPRSVREMKDYLYRKTMMRPVRNRRTGEVVMKEGLSESVTARVLSALLDKGYVSDEKFADFWVRHRYMQKGTSMRKLRAELQAKGVSPSLIDAALADSERADETELQKVIAKKRARYPDTMKLMQYLARQGFRYDDIKAALNEDS
jgi:regulatory protein